VVRSTRAGVRAAPSHSALNKPGGHLPERDARGADVGFCGRGRGTSSVANSATLIYGTRDAVLVDTFLTLDRSVQLADEVAASGKKLTYVYITHGDGDHFFGLSALKQRDLGNGSASAVETAVRIHSQVRR
jgi:glyoxylase-like metal-dependent hydrolase (beta-lactamase superfamily II)